MKIKVNCKYCNKEFKVIPSIIKRGWGKFCPKSKCCAKWRSENLKGGNSPAWKGGKIKINCNYCGKGFEVFPYQIKNKENRFCPKSNCYAKWLSANNRGKNNPLFGLKGRNNPTWKGGPENWKSRDTGSNKYKLWRKAVFERDNYRCLICGEVGGYLNAHHIKNWIGHPKLRYDVNNGMTMCQKCHDLVDKELPLFSIKTKKIKA